MVKVEALARLQSDQARLIYPDEFIPLLGEVELARLFQFGLQQLLEHLARWHRGGLMIGASINLSPSTFHAPDTPVLVAEGLSRHGIAPKYLSLESCSNPAPSTTWPSGRRVSASPRSA